MAGTTYRLLKPSRDIPTELKVIPITAAATTNILQTFGRVAIEMLILSRTGDITITLNNEPAYVLTAGLAESINNCVIESIVHTGSTAGFIKLFLIDVNTALRNGWISV